jgi:hypothetical protein
LGATEVSQILNNFFTLGAETATQILKDIGFEFWDVVWALVNSFSIAYNIADEIVTSIFS